MALGINEIVGFRNGSVTHVKAFGGEVCLRPLAGDDRDAFEQRYQKEQYVGLRAMVVAGCLCDESGKRLKPDAKQVSQLGQVDCTELDKLFEKACEISGLRTRDARAIEKNLSEALSAVSGSG